MSAGVVEYTERGHLWRWRAPRRPLHLARCWCWRDGLADTLAVISRRPRSPWWARLLESGAR